MKGLIFLLLMISSFLHADPKSFTIQFPMHEDTRVWIKGSSDQDQLVAFEEYFLEGQNKNTWTELLALQYFIARIDFSLKTYFDNAIKALAKDLCNSKIDSRIIEQGENHLFAEWWIKERSENDQHEWVHIFKRENHVGIIRYTTKKLSLVPIQGKLWEKILRGAYFEPN